MKMFSFYYMNNYDYSTVRSIKSVINLFKLIIASVYFRTFVFVLFRLFIYLVVSMIIIFTSILHCFSSKSLALSCGPLEILRPILKMSDLVY